MADLFVTWINDQTIVVKDSAASELWRGRWEAINLLRALADCSIIGLYEDVADEEETDMDSDSEKSE